MLFKNVMGYAHLYYLNDNKVCYFLGEDKITKNKENKSTAVYSRTENEFKW